MHRVKTREEWEQLIQRYRELGVSRKTFCNQEGLKLSTFSYWYRKINRADDFEEKSLTCVELPLPHMGTRIAEEVLDTQIQSDEIRIPISGDSASVIIRGSISLALLARIAGACSGENNVHH